MAEDMDQDKLAEEWAKALEDIDESDAPAAPKADSGGGGGGGGGGDEALADEWAAALAETEQASLKKEKEQKFLQTQAHDVKLKDMTETAKGPRPEGTKRDLEFILDIPLEVSAELGRTKLLINELLQLGQGSVVELNKLAGEPLEIYVNGKLVARGEAVVINEKFGIRLTDIISPIERVKQLA
ncbi:MAG: flagellar motor switch protein FliN [Desulfovibrionaceae bacterium]